MTQPPKRSIRGDSLVGRIDVFLDWCQKHRAPDTYESYLDRLQRFAEAYPHLTTTQLRPYHVQQWLDAMEGVSSETRRNYCRAIKRTTRWAEQQGYHLGLQEFQAAIQETIAHLTTRHAEPLESPMTFNFQRFKDVALLAA